MQMIGEPTRLRLTTDPATDRCPDWSPAGQRIAFLRELPNGKLGVYLVPPLGGVERKLAEVDVALEAARGTPKIAWSPDSKSLVVGDRSSAPGPVALYLLSVDTGRETKLTSPPAGVWGDRDPAFSPSGRDLAFVRATFTGPGDLYLLPLAGNFTANGEPVRLTSNSRYTFSPTWTPEGNDILYAAGDQPFTVGLWRVAAPVRANRDASRMPATAFTV